MLWEKNGFVIWYKRLEQHRFPWPKRFDVDTLTLTGQQLNWLLDGIDVWRMKPHDAPQAALRTCTCVCVDWRT